MAEKDYRKSFTERVVWWTQHLQRTNAERIAAAGDEEDQVVEEMAFAFALSMVTPSAMAGLPEEMAEDFKTRAVEVGEVIHQVLANNGDLDPEALRARIEEALAKSVLS